MGAINAGRVITGGLVAGLVANVIDFVTNTFLMSSDWEAFARSHNMDPAAMTSPSTAVTWVVIDFLLGILLVWTYAAIRPRFGPGPKTAIYSGLLLYLVPTFVLFGFTMLGLMTMGMFVKGSLFAIVSTLAASLAGAAVYKEEAAPARSAGYART